MLASLVVLSALALGGAHVLVVLVGCVGMGISAFLAARGGAFRKLPSPALVLAGLGLFSLLQAIPLPLSWLNVLSAHSADVWRRTLLPFRETLSYGSLSLDPGASTVEAAKWLSYAAAFTIASHYASRRGATGAVVTVFVSACVVAITTLIHALLGATRVFGVYAPRFGTSPNHVGPFLNSNCLAGYLVLGSLCGFGLVLGCNSNGTRLFWAVGTAVLASAAILAGSRGGAAALGVGILLFVAVAYSTQRRRVRSLKWGHWVALGGALLSAAAFALLGVTDNWFELRDTDTTKLRMFGWVIPMLRDFPVFGVGRGAFESAFPAYKRVADSLVYANPENLPAQWLSEWGLLVAPCAAAGLAWQLRPSQLSIVSHLPSLGASVGVGAIVLQNFVDFSLELFAPMLAVAVLLGACWGHGRKHWRGEQLVAAPRWRRAASYALLALLPVCTVLAAVRGLSPVSSERLALTERLKTVTSAEKEAAQQAWASLRNAMLRHPADPYFPRLGALLAVRLGDVEPMPFISRALDRGQVDSRTHWVLALILRQHGFLPQALLEARLAVEYDNSMAAHVGANVARWSQSVDDIERAAPPGTAGAEVRLYAAKQLDFTQYGVEREALLRAAVRVAPGSPAALTALAGELLAQMAQDRCARAKHDSCESDVRAAADALDRLKPHAADGTEILARLAVRTEDAQTLERLFSRCPQLEEQERFRCWRSLFAAARALSKPDLLVRAADSFAKAACRFGSGCTSALLQAGDAVASIKAWPEAMLYYERAVRDEPTVDSLLRLADAAMALGQFSTASRAVTMAAGHARSKPALMRQVKVKRETLLHTINAASPR